MKKFYKVLSLLFFSIGFLYSNTSNAQTHLVNSVADGTTVVTCGDYIYDSGGYSGNYGNNQDYTVTYCSADGGPIRLNIFVLQNVQILCH